MLLMVTGCCGGGGNAVPELPANPPGTYSTAAELGIAVDSANSASLLVSEFTMIKEDGLGCPGLAGSVPGLNSAKLIPTLDSNDACEVGARYVRSAT